MEQNLLFSDSLYENEQLHTRVTDALFIMLPEYLNKSEHGDWSFERLVEHLEEINSHNNNNNHTGPQNNDGHSVEGQPANNSSHHSLGFIEDPGLLVR